MTRYFSKKEIFSSFIEQIKNESSYTILSDDLYYLIMDGNRNKKNFVTLVSLMDKVRRLLNTPVILTSTLRLESYNANLKGSSRNSGHLTFEAFDFTIRGDLFDAYEKIKGRLEELGITELILYPKRRIIHVGIKKRDNVYVKVDKS